MTDTQLRSALSLSLTASDLPRSMDFYTNGLGFSVDERFETGGVLQGAMLSAGDAHLGVSQDDFSKGRDRKKGVGCSIHLETEQDIRELAKRAKDAGVSLNGEPAPLPWGPLGFSVTDPDGFTVVVSNPA